MMGTLSIGKFQNSTTVVQHRHPQSFSSKEARKYCHYSYFYSEIKFTFFFSDKMPELQNVIPSLSSVIASALSMRYFYSQSATNPRQFPYPNEIYYYSEMYAKVDIGSLMFGKDLPTTPVPCRFISSLGSNAWDVALCLISF